MLNDLEQVIARIVIKQGPEGLYHYSVDDLPYSKDWPRILRELETYIDQVVRPFVEKGSNGKPKAR